MARNDERSARIGRDFSFWQLIWFCVPAIMTNLFTALFRTLDDGLFLSRFVGTNALAAFSIAMPVFMLFMGANVLMNGLIFIVLSILVSYVFSYLGNTGWANLFLTLFILLVFANHYYFKLL